MAGLTGTVTTSAYNDSYGNYVVIKDSKGYELRYAHLLLQNRASSVRKIYSQIALVQLCGIALECAMLPWGGNEMKVAVWKSPKCLCGLLRCIFHIR